VNDFIVYPKNSEKTFTIDIHKFEVGEDEITLFNSGNAASDFGFLAKTKTAAIVTTRPNRNEAAIEFLVHLTGDRIITVYADAFRLEPELTFYWFGPKEKAISGVYIDSSDVVAIMPAQGLQMYFGDTLTSRG
jgi:hypothetical protein